MSVPTIEELLKLAAQKKPGDEVTELPPEQAEDKAYIKEEKRRQQARQQVEEFLRRVGIQQGRCKVQCRIAYSLFKKLFSKPIIKNQFHQYMSNFYTSTEEVHGKKVYYYYMWNLSPFAISEKIEELRKNEKINIKEENPKETEGN